MKKIHRFLALFVLGFGLIQVTTGLLLKFPQFTRNLFNLGDLDGLRAIHGANGSIFAVFFLVMMFTGTWMFFYTRWLRRKTRNNQNDKPVEPQA